MTDKQRHQKKKRREERLREAKELERAAARLPGVAELVHLYKQHAETVRRTQAYMAPAGKITIITSGAASA